MSSGRRELDNARDALPPPAAAPPPLSGGGKGGAPRDATIARLAELAPKALDLIADELDDEKKPRCGARTRLITAKWLIECVLELPQPAAAESTDKPNATPMTPAAAVSELRKRLSGQ